MNYALLLKKYIEDSGFTLEEISEICAEYGVKVHPTYISKLRLGQRPAPDRSISEALARATGGDSRSLVWQGYVDQAPDEVKAALYREMNRLKDIAHGPEGRPKTQTDDDYVYDYDDLFGASTVPILGTIRAGVPLLAHDNWDGQIQVPANLDADFALRVTGDSMCWAGIHDGDIAVMQQLQNPSHGMIVAAGIEDATWEATLKYYIQENGQALLRAANPEYEDIPYKKGYRVIGLTVAILKEPPAYSTYRQLLLRKDLTDRKWQLAVETAQQHGLDGEKVANLISIFGQTSKHIK